MDKFSELKKRISCFLLDLHDSNVGEGKVFWKWLAEEQLAASKAVAKCSGVEEYLKLRKHNEALDLCGVYEIEEELGFSFKNN